MKNLNHLKGFTLAEVMLSLGILTLILTISLPDIARLFADQKSKIDELQTEDISRALGAYAKVTKTLPLAEPVDGKDWADELAKYSKLSAAEMRIDAWGNPRIYEMYVNSGQGYRQGALDIYYATVLSLGEENVNDSYVEGEGSVTAPKRTWSDLDEDAYANYRPEGDDLVARFSDFEYKTELYELRVERLQRIVDALESYAGDKFNDADVAAQAACGSGSCGLPARIYYPRSGDSSSAVNASVTVTYDAAVLTDMQSIISKQILVPGDESDTKGLMRLLNLPENYAIDPISDAAFFYYSNPKPGAGCTEGRTKAPFMPIIISVDEACVGSDKW